MSKGSKLAISCTYRVIGRVSQPIAMGILGCAKPFSRAITYRPPVKKIAGQVKPRRFRQSLANLRHSLRMANGVLRQGSWIFPHHAVNRRASDAEKFCVFRMNGLGKDVIGDVGDLNSTFFSYITGHQYHSVRGMLSE